MSARGASVCATCGALLGPDPATCARCGDRAAADGAPRLPLLLAGCRPAPAPVRILAVGLDALLAVVLAAPAVAGFALASLPGSAVVVSLVVVGVYAAACVVGQALTGRTPAKLLLGLRSVDLLTGLPLGLRRGPAEWRASGVVLDVRGARDPATTVDDAVWTRLTQLASTGSAQPAVPTPSSATPGAATVLATPLVPATPPAPATPLTPATPLAPRTPAVPGMPSDDGDLPEATRMRPARATVPQVPAADVLVLRLDDGQRFEVRGTALLGRNPQPRPGEDVGALIPVTDLARSVSKTHAQVRWDGRTCWVRDRGSTNGTSVVDAAGRRPVTEAAEVAVAPGGSVRIGDRELVLEPGGRT